MPTGFWSKQSPEPSISSFSCSWCSPSKSFRPLEDMLKPKNKFWACMHLRFLPKFNSNSSDHDPTTWAYFELGSKIDKLVFLSPTFSSQAPRILYRLYSITIGMQIQCHDARSHRARGAASQAPENPFHQN